VDCYIQELGFTDPHQRYIATNWSWSLEVILEPPGVILDGVKFFNPEIVGGDTKPNQFTHVYGWRWWRIAQPVTLWLED
jgi:hypothetical protein